MGVLKVRDAAGNWVPIGVGIQAQPETRYAASAGGTVAAGTSPTICTLTIPAGIWQNGRVFVVTMTAVLAQATQSVFDLNYNFAGDNVPDQVTNLNATGKVFVCSRPWIASGAAQTFLMTLNNWGAQPVTYSNKTNIVAIAT